MQKKKNENPNEIETGFLPRMNHRSSDPWTEEEVARWL